eukprot:TRINITY_DN17907_c0_g1_i1.p2 TRINITY_DN17907_c0_g1~~TRINITY_DN17907_c0_g1_i1.p2  ORF type:complete len:207 (-),score=53.36 TRINITY_DN17907_c0_g1_i1:208-828(-)
MCIRDRYQRRVHGEELRTHFKECGDIINIRCLRDSKTHEGRGIGYIYFVTKQAFQKVLQLNKSTLRNRVLRIKKAVPPQRLAKKQLKKQEFDGDKTNKLNAKRRLNGKSTSEKKNMKSKKNNSERSKSKDFKSNQNKASVQSSNAAKPIIKKKIQKNKLNVKHIKNKQGKIQEDKQEPKSQDRNIFNNPSYTKTQKSKKNRGNKKK